MRRNSRELTFKFIYESIFSLNQTQEEIDFSLREQDFVNYEKEEFEFAVAVYKKFFENKTEILQTLSSNIKGYPIERVFKIDLALLSLVIVEHNHFETPLPVITNEVLELAKVYSTHKSPGFINGVISTIYGEKDVE